jgi:hypothetical protein
MGVLEITRPTSCAIAPVAMQAKPKTARDEK